MRKSPRVAILKTNRRQPANPLAERGRRNQSLKRPLTRRKRVRLPTIHIALVEDNPLRRVGFHSILDTVPNFRLTVMSLPEITADSSVDLVLFGSCSGVTLLDTMANLKSLRPNLRAIVTGSGTDDETIVKALTSGAKGYVDEAATKSHFVKAILGVHRGSVWASRRVISLLIEGSRDFIKCNYRPVGSEPTCREKQVLSWLVAGCSNQEVGNALGIKARTVKVHVAKLMRKVGVRNRVALSVYAVRHSLVSVQ
jgi:DNA-binding NarL/FixJ family response regulator